MAFYLIVSFITFFFFYFMLNKRSKGAKPLNLPPGPPKLPVIGNIHQLVGLLPHRAFRDLARKHGPILHVQLGQTQAVIISSPRLAKEALKTNDIAIADRPTTFGSELVLYGNTSIGFASYGEYWRQMKKVSSLELLSARKVRSFGLIREQELDRFMGFLRSSCGKPVNLHESITELINNVVCKASFGKDCKHQRALVEFLDELSRVNSGLSVADLFPDYKFLYVVSGLRSKLTKLHKTLDKIFNDILEEHEGRRDGEAQEEDLLQVLLKIQEEGGFEFPITNDNIKAIFVDVFGGGTDTSTITIEWAMTEMMRRPSVMNKAQAEVRKVFKGKTKITESEMQGSLSYLQSVIKETLRLHPPVPLLVPHVCREQCTIGGYDIPVKMKVIINAWACSTDPEYWEDAETFKPERFENNPVDFMGTYYQFIPFGSGRRMCPGITFGMTSVESVLAQMLYHFDWKLPGESNDMDIDMTEAEGMLAAKKVHLHLIPTTYDPYN